VSHPSDSRIAWVTIDQAGVYKTTNGGESWQLLSQGLPTEGTSFWSIAVGKDGETLYAGNKNFRKEPGVYKSTDGGSSWNRVFYSNNQIDIKDRPYPGGINPWWVEVDPNSDDAVYAGTDNAVYGSIDGGETWSVLTARQTPGGWQGNGFSGLVARNVEWNPYNFEHIVLQGMDAAKAIQSWDSGENWRVNNPGLPNYDGGHDITFAPGWIFMALGQSSRTSELIARSQDEGRSWTLLNPPIEPSEATDVHTNPDNPDQLWAVVNGQLWYTDDATQTTTPEWTSLTVGATDNYFGDIEALSQDKNAFYIATDRGIYYTENGNEFRFIGGPGQAENVNLAVAPSEPKVLYAVQNKSYWNDYGVWRYDATKNNWERIWDDRDITARIGDIAVHPTNPDILALVTVDYPYHDETWATGVWISRNAGETWSQENSGLPMLRGNTIAFHPNGKSLVVGLGGAGFYTADFE
jgi:photosystem II stability/assembly factor-like uncharacterized protein